MIRAEGLTKWYSPERPAIDHVSFAVAPGEVYCMLGADGAGKSTLLDCVAGVVKPTGGSVRANGLRSGAGTAAYLPAALPAALTPVENLLLQCRIAGSGPRRAAGMRNLLREMGIPEEQFERPAGALTRGQMQRLGLAAAAARGAGEIIADDPTAGLPPHEVREFLRHLARLRDSGAAVLYATHDSYVARQIANRVGILKQGLLVLELKNADLRDFDLDALTRGSPDHA